MVGVSETLRRSFVLLVNGRMYLDIFFVVNSDSQELPMT